MKALLDKSLAGAMLVCMVVSVIVASLGLPLGNQVVKRCLPVDRKAQRRAGTMWRWKAG